MLSFSTLFYPPRLQEHRSRICKVCKVFTPQYFVRCTYTSEKETKNIMKIVKCVINESVFHNDFKQWMLNKTWLFNFQIKFYVLRLSLYAFTPQVSSHFLSPWDCIMLYRYSCFTAVLSCIYCHIEIIVLKLPLHLIPWSFASSAVFESSGRVAWIKLPAILGSLCSDPQFCAAVSSGSFSIGQRLIVPMTTQPPSFELRLHGPFILRSQAEAALSLSIQVWIETF